MAASSLRSVTHREVAGRLITSQVVRGLLSVLKHIFIIVLAVSFFLPFYWMFASALKDRAQVYSYPPVWWPVPQHWYNFPDAWNFEVMNWPLYTVNTVFKYGIPATLGALCSSVLVAYGFARLNWPGRDALFGVCLGTMMVPYAVRMVPLYILFKRLGVPSGYLPLVLPTWLGGAPVFIFMLRQFFRTIPYDLTDAARIDGESELGLLMRIIVPLSRPALAVVVLFQFIWSWNDYLGPLIYANRPENWSLALAIQVLRTEMDEIGITEQFLYPWIMAISCIITLPVVLLFFFAQRTFVEGVTLTGLKG